MLEQVQPIRRSREIIARFRGLNQNEVQGQEDLTVLDHLVPCERDAVKTRTRRGSLKTIAGFGGMIGKDKLFWIENGGIWYDGGRYGDITAGAKQLVSMGAKVLIFPDKKAFDTQTRLITSLENTVTITGAVTAALSKQDGTAYAGYTTGTTAPTDPANGALWMDTNGGGSSLKEYAAATDSWVSVATTYIKITATGIGNGFKAGDGVTLTGITAGAVNGDVILAGAGPNWILLIGILSATHSQTGGVTVKRKVPDMDFIVSVNNRAFGCSSKDHEIYACKLGDATNWRAYEGLASDSYAVTVGSDGDFTGAAVHMGQVLFFKENCMHKLYGTMPSNYQLMELLYSGVEKGSEKSICTINEVLYYKSRDAVMAYDGTMPRPVSGKLNPKVYHNVRAGRQGDDLYLSMQSAGQNYMMVLDTEKWEWRSEGTDRAAAFTDCGGYGYYVRETDGQLMAIRQDAPGTLFDDVTIEGPVSFAMATGDLMGVVPDMKRMARVQVKLELEAGAMACAGVSYDGGAYMDVITCRTDKKRFFVMPIIPRRCQSMKIRITGTGDAIIYGLSMYVDGGSDYYV